MTFVLGSSESWSYFEKNRGLRGPLYSCNINGRYGGNCNVPIWASRCGGRMNTAGSMGCGSGTYYSLSEMDRENDIDSPFPVTGSWLGLEIDPNDELFME